jgi:hypothetical protein
MNQNTHTQLTNIEKARKQVNGSTPESIIQAIATQMDRLDEARRRIDEEGIVVRDLTGSVIEHPAIKVELNATKMLSDLMGRNRKMGK